VEVLHQLLLVGKRGIAGPGRTAPAAALAVTPALWDLLRRDRGCRRCWCGCMGCCWCNAPRRSCVRSMFRGYYCKDCIATAKHRDARPAFVRRSETSTCRNELQLQLSF
jgi:hypothetical protein